MESESGEDGECVGSEMRDCAGWEPMVRWRRGISRPCPASHRHGTATSGVHMGIIVKFGEALPCVKSPISRTAGSIYAVMRVENVLVRTPSKEEVDRYE